MKAKTGFFQELQPDGSIANSSIRLFMLFFFILLCAYTSSSLLIYQNNLDHFIVLLKDKCITEQSFNMLVLQTNKIDWNVFTILVIATVVPKAIQKFAEMKTGFKDTTETTTKTSTSDQTIKTTN